MSDSDVVQKIVTIEIELEEDDGPLMNQTAPGEELELTETTEKPLTEQKDNEKKQEERKEEETNVTIKQEKVDEPEEHERVESGGSERSLARQQHILYRHPQRYTEAVPSTWEKTEDKIVGDDNHKGKADNETGEGRSGAGESGESGSGQGTSGEGTGGEGARGDEASGEKKAKIEESSIVEDDDSNSASECFIVFD